MARTSLTKQQPNRSTGLNATYTAPSGTGAGEGYALAANTGNEMLHVKNAGGSPVVVSLIIAKQVDGVTPDPKTVTIAAATDRFIGPFPTSDYNQNDSTVRIEFDGVTSVTGAWLKSF